MKVLNHLERNNTFSSIYSLLTARKGNDDQLIIQSFPIAQTRDHGQLEGKTFEGNSLAQKRWASDKANHACENML